MITAPTLVSARETLINLAERRAALEVQVTEQSRRMDDLDREIQRLFLVLSQSEQALADSRQEVLSLRAQLPDEATRAAFEELSRHLKGSSSEVTSPFKVAA